MCFKTRGKVVPRITNNIFIADDEPEIVKVLSEALSEYDPLTTCSAREAIEIIKGTEFPFALVVSDFDFKDKAYDGLSIYSEYRSKFPHSTFLFHSGSDSDLLSSSVKRDSNAHFVLKATSNLIEFIKELIGKTERNLTDS